MKTLEQLFNEAMASTSIHTLLALVVRLVELEEPALKAKPVVVKAEELPAEGETSPAPIVKPAASGDGLESGTGGAALKAPVAPAPVKPAEPVKPVVAAPMPPPPMTTVKPVDASGTMAGKPVVAAPDPVAKPADVKEQVAAGDHAAA